MEKDYGSFTWSDNWQVEGNQAWFVSGRHNILFCLNLMTNECETVVLIPEKSPSRFRLTPHCMKCGNDIFCMPDNGKSIWIYDRKKNSFSEITLDNPGRVRLILRDFWEYDNKLFVVSNGLSRIFEIDIAKKKMKGCYKLCDGKGIRKSIKVETDIYSLSDTSDEIFRFNLVTKEITTYKLPDIGRKFSTLCFDGEKFWLSGYRREIYVWDMEENVMKTICSFPDGFGVYNFTKDTEGEVDSITDEYEQPVFLCSAAVGENIWFIPYQANKILYIGKEDTRLHAFEPDEENETKQSLLGRTDLYSKYILEYIREDRYMGLFSVKNNHILEIDTLGMTSERKKYSFNDECMNEISKICCGNIFYENNNKFDGKIFRNMLINQKEKRKNEIISDIGSKIYEEMLKL